MGTRPLVGNMLTLLDLHERFLTKHTCKPKKDVTSPKLSPLLTLLTKFWYSHNVDASNKILAFALETRKKKKTNCSGRCFEGYMYEIEFIEDKWSRAID